MDKKILNKHAKDVYRHFFRDTYPISTYDDHVDYDEYQDILNLQAHKAAVDNCYHSLVSRRIRRIALRAYSTIFENEKPKNYISQPMSYLEEYQFIENQHKELLTKLQQMKNK